MDDRLRFRAWDKEKKVMYPSWPIWKTDFGDMEIDNLILMQCTGLKDINGKLIYHKDLYRQEIWWGGENHGIETGVIVWHYAGFKLEINGLYFDIEMKGEVIGNVYDNLALVEG